MDRARGAGRSIARALCALLLCLLHTSCDNPAASIGGPIRLAVQTVDVDDYGGDNDAELWLNFDSAIMAWDSPVSGESVIGAFVEIRFGSQSTDLAYVPVASWLRSKGDLAPGPIQVARRGRGLRIDDPQRILLGETIAVSSPTSRFRAAQLDTLEFVVRRGDYVELQWPAFASAVQFESMDIYMRAVWNEDSLQRSGTYVEAWVKQVDESGDITFVPVDTWLFESDKYSPNNLYLSEIGYYTRYRDRSFALLGQTIVIAFVTSDE